MKTWSEAWRFYRWVFLRWRDVGREIIAAYRKTTEEMERES